MATAKGGYYTKDGTRVPSVTTVLSRFKESGALIHWAAGQAAEYILRNTPDNPTRADVVKLAEQAKFAYRDVRDEAAEAGTMAHDAVECWIRQKPFTFAGKKDTIAKAKRAFESFLEWAQQTKLVVTHTEVPLVSERYAFGGTLDAMLINGKRALGDWKTSNAIYADYICQIAAYGVLWEENFPDQTIDGGFHLFRFDKSHAGDFAHRYWTELDDAREAFLLMRQLYAFDPLLKARVK
jgi:hypothetical protein